MAHSDDTFTMASLQLPDDHFESRHIFNNLSVFSCVRACSPFANDNGRLHGTSYFLLHRIGLSNSCRNQ